MLVLRTLRCTYPNSLGLDRSCEGAEGAKFGCVAGSSSFLVLIGMAVDTADEDAVACSVGGEGVAMPAGEATELGAMKSSRFMGSGSGSWSESGGLVRSWDWRNWAMPECVLFVCRANLPRAKVQ